MLTAVRTVLICGMVAVINIVKASLHLTTLLNTVPAGVKVMEEVCVEKVLVEKERVTGIVTDKGEVKCDVFVNCGGQVQ